MVRGGGGEKREKKEEREVQVSQAVIDWCFVFVVPQRSNKTTGYLVEGRRFRLRLPSNWLHTSLCKVVTCFSVLCFWKRAANGRKIPSLLLGSIFGGKYFPCKAQL